MGAVVWVWEYFAVVLVVVDWCVPYAELVYPIRCGRKQAFSGRVGVRVLVWPPDRRTRDLDNLLKGLLDSITGAGVILDDCQIDEIHMMRESVRKGGAVQVWLWARSQTDER